MITYTQYVLSQVNPWLLALMYGFIVQQAQLTHRHRMYKLYIIYMYINTEGSMAEDKLMGWVRLGVAGGKACSMSTTATLAFRVCLEK